MEKIKGNIFWIGSDAPESRDFHGISTPRGGSYNSYLVLDRKKVLIDVCNKPYLEKYLKSLREAIDPEKINYIIINHAEPDHTGAIKHIAGVCKNAKIVCTEKCKEFLIQQFDIDADFQTVKDCDEIGLGKQKLQFYTMPMVHWPEVMMTYLTEEKMLFSSDLFGTEISREKMFADEMDDFSLLTRDYFAIVMRPLHNQVKKAIEKAKGLELEYICPSHGPVYRQPQTIIDTYEKLANDPEEDKVTLIYYSIWHSTEKMAHDIEEKLKEKGKKVEIFDISKANMVHMMSSAMTSNILILGSMTILANYHPLFESLFALLKANDQPGKKAFAFGSFGWSSQAVPKLKTKLEELGYDVDFTLESKFRPAAVDEFVDQLI